MFFKKRNKNEKIEDETIFISFFLLFNFLKSTFLSFPPKLDGKEEQTHTYFYFIKKYQALYGTVRFNDLKSQKNVLANINGENGCEELT